MAFTKTQSDDINERISTALGVIRAEFKINVTTLTNDLATVDAYAKEITARVTATQITSEEAFNVTIAAFTKQATEDKDEAAAGVEKIRSIGEKVETQCAQGIANLELAAKLQKVELEKIQAASQELEGKVAAIQAQVREEIAGCKTSVGAYVAQERTTIEATVSTQREQVSELLKNGETNLATQFKAKEEKLTAMEASMKASLNSLGAELKSGILPSGDRRGFNADGTRQSSLIDPKATSVEKMSDDMGVLEFKAYRKSFHLHLESFPELKGFTK